MKTNNSISSQFGLTQQEMAALLGVSVSLYSMFECGQRSLPLHAQTSLRDVLQHMNKLETEEQKTAIGTKAELKENISTQHNYLKNLHLTLELKTLKLQKQITKLQLKLQSLYRKQHLLSYLTQKSEKTPKPALNLLLHNIRKADPAPLELQLFILQTQLELTQAQTQMLKLKLQ